MKRGATAIWVREFVDAKVGNSFTRQFLLTEGKKKKFGVMAMQGILNQLVEEGVLKRTSTRGEYIRVQKTAKQAGSSESEILRVG